MSTILTWLAVVALGIAALCVLIEIVVHRRALRDRLLERRVAAARALHAEDYEPWDPPDPAEVRRHGPVWSDQ